MCLPAPPPRLRASRAPVLAILAGLGGLLGAFPVAGADGAYGSPLPACAGGPGGGFSPESGAVPSPLPAAILPASAPGGPASLEGRCGSPGGPGQDDSGRMDRSAVPRAGACAGPLGVRSPAWGAGASFAREALARAGRLSDPGTAPPFFPF